MKGTLLVAALAFTVGSGGYVAGSENEVQKLQRPEKPGRSAAVTTLAKNGADDNQIETEVQKPQRPEKPGRHA